jgi:hypothetical protein
MLGRLIVHDIFDEQRNIPFYGTQSDLEALEALVSNCLKVLRDAERVREMVLETWLTVDYAIRQFLLSGFEVSRFSTEEFDLRRELLPRDFSRLLELLELTVRFNADLPLDAEPAKPDKVGGFRASAEFWRFVEDHSPGLLPSIEQVRRQYVRAKNPEIPAESIEAGAFFIDEAKPEIATMKLEWRRVASNLDDAWFKKAKQLNRARNFAAHSFRPEKVTEALGLAGPNTVSQTRDKCFEILRSLLGVREEAIRD